jgi:hypothetical protein
LNESSLSKIARIMGAGKPKIRSIPLRRRVFRRALEEILHGKDFFKVSHAYPGTFNNPGKHVVILKGYGYPVHGDITKNYIPG